MECYTPKRRFRFLMVMSLGASRSLRRGVVLRLLHAVTYYGLGSLIGPALHESAPGPAKTRILVFCFRSVCWNLRQLCRIWRGF